VLLISNLDVLSRSIPVFLKGRVVLCVWFNFISYPSEANEDSNSCVTITII